MSLIVWAGVMWDIVERLVKSRQSLSHVQQHYRPARPSALLRHSSAPRRLRLQFHQRQLVPQCPPRQLLQHQQHHRLQLLKTVATRIHQERYNRHRAWLVSKKVVTILFVKFVNISLSTCSHIVFILAITVNPVVRLDDKQAHYPSKQHLHYCSNIL